MATLDPTNPAQVPGLDLSDTAKPLQDLEPRQRSLEIHHSPEIQLEEEIRQLIEPWKDSSEKPPFTMEELVVIALVLNQDSTAKDAEIWIVRTFKYYHELVLEASARNNSFLLRHYSLPPSERVPIQEHSDFQLLFAEAFRRFDVPVAPGETILSNNLTQQKWCVSGPAARLFLASRLRTKAESEELSKPFPLMELPAELRIRIYEYALGYPETGICIKRRYATSGHKIAEMKTVSRQNVPLHELSPSDRASLELYNRSNLDPTGGQICSPMSISLALLQVSKQVFQEAMPVFFSINNFAFLNIVDLHAILQATPASRRKHIGHISLRFRPESLRRPNFNFRSGAEQSAREAFRLMKTITYLRKLDIEMDEAEWGNALTETGEAKYPDVTKIPGIRDLGGLRGLKAVRFHGHCDSLKKLIPDMLKEKPQLKPAQKRKRGSDEDKGGSGKAKKPKAPKAKDGKNSQLHDPSSRADS